MSRARFAYLWRAAIQGDSAAENELLTMAVAVALVALAGLLWLVR